MVRPFSLLVKPASADCNLRCKYCFYLEHLSFYPEEKVHRMNDETLSTMIKTYMATNQRGFQFGWQGGEPTLMGHEFFQRAVDFQKKYGRSGTTVSNGLQTNGTMITDDLARVLHDYQFLVGLSVDGPAEVHDHYRITTQSNGSHNLVMKGMQKLKDFKVEFNTLTLINDLNVQRPEQTYDYLCELGSFHHQYIACVEPDPTLKILPFSTSAEAWGEFLCAIFDRWYKSDTRKVSIRLFDSILSLLVDNVRNICPMGTNCCQYFVVEYNGDVYPCDFFVEKRLQIGNVKSDSWESMQTSPVYVDFGKQKRMWNCECDDCEFAWICAGDCLKHRLCTGGGDPRNISALCKGWKVFYKHTMPRFQKLANEIKQERELAYRQQQAAMMMNTGQKIAAAKIGRNDPCPCGSGKKYKKCCGR